MDGPSHEGAAAAPADRRIRCRAQRARPSHPTKKAAAIITMLQRQASAPGEGTPLTEAKPTTTIRLATEQTSAVANIVLTVSCRTFNNVCAASGCTSAQILPERARAWRIYAALATGNGHRLRAALDVVVASADTITSRLPWRRHRGRWP